MSEGKNVVVRVSRRFTQSAERVFDAWLDVEKARLFMFATETGEMVKCEIDPRVGGKYVMTDRRPDGEVEHGGEFLEIVRPHRLVFTFGIPAESPDFDIVTIEIAPLESGCELTLTTEMKPAWAAYADRAREGWGKILDRLAAAVA
jgi:uncharacterized protein YndB with AHSA1/START domain